MAKRKKEHTDWVITKGQLARWQKEQQRRRHVIIIVSVIITIVVALLVYAIIDVSKSNNPTILKVQGPQGERSFSLNYYADMLSLYGIREAKPSEQGSKALAVLNVIENNEKIRQLATELGVSVSKEELDKRIVKELYSPAEPGTANPSNVATPSYEELVAQYSPFLKDKGNTVEQFRQAVEYEMLSQKLQEYIEEKEVPEQSMHAYVQAIQIDTSPPVSSGTSEDIETIDPMNIYEEVKARLDEDEDFNVLAEEYSSTGAVSDLGWLPEEIASMFYGEEFADSAFNLETNTLSQPIPASEAETNTHYWLIRVTEREQRLIEESYRMILGNQAFGQWYENQMQRFSIEVRLDNELLQDAVSKALN